MQKATRRLVVAVATHPSIVKLFALYAFRLVRTVGRAAGQRPERLRWFANEVSGAWVQSGQETQR